MEYIAIREPTIEQLNDQSAAMQCQHQGHSWGATHLKSKITPEFVRSEVARGRAHHEQHQPSRE
jgi:phosphomethylpyrimidine synthase